MAKLEAIRPLRLPLAGRRQSGKPGLLSTQVDLADNSHRAGLDWRLYKTAAF